MACKSRDVALASFSIMILRMTWKHMIYGVSDEEWRELVVFPSLLLVACPQTLQLRAIPRLEVAVFICINMKQEHQQAKIVGGSHSQCDCYRQGIDCCWCGICCCKINLQPSAAGAGMLAWWCRCSTMHRLLLS